jgi:hypothetical protein
MNRKEKKRLKMNRNKLRSASALIRVTVEIVPTFIVSYLRVNSCPALKAPCLSKNFSP